MLSVTTGMINVSACKRADSQHTVRSTSNIRVNNIIRLSQHFAAFCHSSKNLGILTEIAKFSGLRTSALIYSREESTARETEVVQEDAGWTTSRTGWGGHWRSTQLWPETGISGERRCECPWSPTLRNEKGIGLAMLYSNQQHFNSYHFMIFITA